MTASCPRESSPTTASGVVAYCGTKPTCASARAALGNGNMAGGSSSLAETSTSMGQGDFFAVDRRAWARACSLGINAAVAYLMLARGTGADNRTSTWSVQSIEKYTSVSRGRAQEALKVLQRAGLVQELRAGTRPKYRLAPAHEIPGCECYPP